MKSVSGMLHGYRPRLGFAVLGVVLALAAPGARADGKQALLADVQLQSRTLALAALQIGRANDAGYAHLAQAYANLNNDMKALLRGGSRGSCQVAAPDKATLETMEPMQEAMGMLEKAVNLLDKNRNSQPTLRLTVEKLRGISDTLAVSVQALIDKQTAPAQINTLKTLAQLNLLLARINLHAERLLSPQSLKADNAFAMAKDVTAFSELLDGLAASAPTSKQAALSSEAKSRIGEIGQTFSGMMDARNSILQNLQNAIHYKEVIDIAVKNADLLAEASQTLVKPATAGFGCSVN